MEGPITNPPYATSPFDNTLDGDLILRSSDLVDFRVVRAILRLASPFFASMLEVGQALPNASDGAQVDGDEIRDGCRVVPVSEDSETLGTLLRIIYPQENPVLADFTRVADVLAAALKYDMVKATVLTSTKLRGFVPQDPVRVWAIAVRNRLETEARLAADEIRRQAIVVLDVFPDEMQGINAGAYYRLLRYCRLDRAVEDFTFCDPAGSSTPDSQMTTVIPLSPSLQPDTMMPTSLRSQFRAISDIVCRSSDGHEFPAHKALLMLASPTVLGPLVSGLSSAAPSGEMDGSLRMPSVLPFDENGETVQILLSLCHSAELDAGLDTDELFLVPKVRAALEKYGMRSALEFLHQRWSTLMAENPLRAYMLASGVKNVEETSKAARLLLDRDMQEYYTSLLETSPASVYRTALLYHRACRDAASEVGALCQSVATGNSPASNNLTQILHASTRCNRNVRPDRYYCSGIMGLVQNPAASACGHCEVYAKMITRAIDMLRSQSDPLLTTLDILRGPSSPNSPSAPSIWLPLNAQDQSSIQALYTQLHDKVVARIDEVCRSRA